MRHSDLGFSLLAIALVAMLSWWWTERYASEKEVLADRIDVKLAAWRTNRIQIGFKNAFVDSVRFSSSESLADVAPGVKVDIDRKRVIRLTQEENEPAESTDQFTIQMDRLSAVLSEGFSMGATKFEVDSALHEIANPLGVRLRLVQTDSTSSSPPDTTGKFFRTVAKQAKIVKDPSDLGADTEETGQLPDYIFIEDYKQSLFARILPELAMGVLLLIGLFAFYGFIRRDLRRREAALAEKDRFIANIAHELKTPIAVVGVALESLEHFGADADPARRSRYVKTSREELGRLEILAERALGTLLLESEDPPSLPSASVDLVELLERSWSTLSLKHDLPTRLPTFVKTGVNATVEGDPLLLRHLFDNLLENAVKYGDNPTSIGVELNTTPREITFAVTDDGPGIPLGERKRVFEKFYRIQTEGEGHRVKGHGLGLSYAGQIVRRHGGSISIASGPGGRGTAVTVNLPRR